LNNYIYDSKPRKTDVGFLISKNGGPISLSRISEFLARLSGCACRRHRIPVQGKRRREKWGSQWESNLIRVSARAVGPALTSHLTLAG